MAGAPRSAGGRAGGCGEAEDVGLTRLGRRYLDRMKAVGMLLDLAFARVQKAVTYVE